MADTCNIALIGQKFMGRAHSNAYLKVERFFNVPVKPVMHTIAGLDLISLAPFADRWGWKKYGTNWKDVVKDPAIGLVDISTPNHMHAEQALAAISAGKHVACEKPLAGTLKDARLMKNAAARSRRSKTFVWFNYRRCPAVAFARQLIQEDRLGRVFHVRARYLQDWGGPDTPMSWRFQKKYAGSGAHGDLSAHIIDMARFLTGQEFVEVLGAMTETFVPDRATPPTSRKTGGRVTQKKKPSRTKVDVDDAVAFVARLEGGTMATFEASRVAHGHQNDNTIEINGEHGSLRFSFEDMNWLWYYDARDEKATAGWRKIMCTSAGNHPYAGAWWPDAHIIGYEHTFVNMVADIMAALGGEEPIVPLPDFADAYETQRVLEAALLAAKHRAAVKLSEIK
ncbi:MAG: Gfo/Idh/MocA family oxidoreductase [Phycisphaerales bacterium]|nr:Gfo/Idh/MocA family oxidoreductase [Phycisphaerales bacterium]